jgi:hypothetical protein
LRLTSARTTREMIASAKIEWLGDTRRADSEAMSEQHFADQTGHYGT